MANKMEKQFEQRFVRRVPGGGRHLCRERVPPKSQYIQLTPPPLVSSLSLARRLSVLAELLKLPDNKECADCGSKGTPPLDPTRLQNRLLRGKTRLM
jgi:hypothetical protein